MSQWRIWGRGPGNLAPHHSLRPNWGLQVQEKLFLRRGFPSYILGTGLAGLEPGLLRSDSVKVLSYQWHVDI